MFTIRKATSADCGLIHKLAWQIFPETYKEILSKEQIEYMMEWMYSLESIRQQMEEEGQFVGRSDNMQRFAQRVIHVHKRTDIRGDNDRLFKER